MDKVWVLTATYPAECCDTVVEIFATPDLAERERFSRNPCPANMDKQYEVREWTVVK